MASLSGLNLRFACRSAQAAARARARILFRGFTPRGHPLWTNEEDEILRRSYPDYRLAIRRLKRRTYGN